MEIGTMDRWLSVQYKVTTRDPGYNTEAITWTELCKVWASMRDVLPGRGETTQDGLQQLARPCRVRMYYRADVTAAMRFVEVQTGRVLQIVSGPAELGYREFIEFLVQDFSTAGVGV